MLNSLSTLRQYLWHHHCQFDCLDGSNKVSFNISGTWTGQLTKNTKKNKTHRSNQENSTSCSLSTYGQDVLRQHHQLHWLTGPWKEWNVHKIDTQKWRASTPIHLHPRWSTVNVVFTFNASAICAAPSTPISFSVYFWRGKKKLG